MQRGLAMVDSAGGFEFEVMMMIIIFMVAALAFMVGQRQDQACRGGGEAGPRGHGALGERSKLAPDEVL